jgi:hypothetical protein
MASRSRPRSRPYKKSRTKSQESSHQSPGRNGPTSPPAETKNQKTVRNQGRQQKSPPWKRGVDFCWFDLFKARYYVGRMFSASSPHPGRLFQGHLLVSTETSRSPVGPGFSQPRDTPGFVNHFHLKARRTRDWPPRFEFSSKSGLRWALQTCPTLGC